VSSALKGAGGVAYKMGPATLHATFTQNKIDSSLNTAAMSYRNMKTQVYSGGGDWLVTPESSSPSNHV
jgi:hypothetical protein